MDSKWETILSVQLCQRQFTFPFLLIRDWKSTLNFSNLYLRSNISWKYRGIEITLGNILPHCFWICPWHILLPWIFCWIASMKPWWACTALLSTIDFLRQNLHFVVLRKNYLTGQDLKMVWFYFFFSLQVCITINNKCWKFLFWFIPFWLIQLGNVCLRPLMLWKSENGRGVLMI